MFSRWWFYVIYVSDWIVALIWDWAGQLRGCGEYWMGRSRRGLLSCSDLQGGSPSLSRLRTNRLALVIKFDYVLAHTGFMGSHKFISFDDRWVGWHPTTLAVMYTGIVYGPPTDARRAIMWKTCIGVRWARLDSLIVVVNCGHLCGFRDSRVSCYQVVTL
jgi:hypothetical protein